MALANVVIDMGRYSKNKRTGCLSLVHMLPFEKICPNIPVFVFCQLLRELATMGEVDRKELYDSLSTNVGDGYDYNTEEESYKLLLMQHIDFTK